jgi:hypothetical protein
VAVPERVEWLTREWPGFPCDSIRSSPVRPVFLLREERTLKVHLVELSSRAVRIFAAAAVVLTAWCGVGCSSAPPVPDLDVEISLDSDTYRIGEPVVATLNVRNRSDEDVVIPALDASTLRFRLTRPGSGELIARDPVLPASSPGNPRVLEPLRTAGRRFVFTRVTAEPGEWGLIAGLYDCMCGTDDGTPVPTLYSRATTFTVVDEVMFERDPHSGIIARNEAVELARAAAGATADTPVRAVLTPLADSGLHRWVVLVGGREDPLHQGTAFEVNPYTGRASRLALDPSPRGGGRE